MKETLFVSFSGGRTSAYMCWWLLNNKADEYDFIFLFANTGQEEEETLIFVDRCDKELGLNLTWLEAVVNPEHGKGIRHKIVDFKTASRTGAPYEAYIKKEGIPNVSAPKCTERLKLRPMESYKRSLGFKSNHTACVGLRVDEIDRMSPRAKESGVIYPLISWAPTTKPEIIHWWGEQSFDLNLPEHLGNCSTCFKKSGRKLLTIAKYFPEKFDFMARMEKEYGDCGPSGETDMKFFRGQSGAIDIIATSKQPFIEFKDYKPELQLKMDFDIDPLDIEGDCGGGCEIG